MSSADRQDLCSAVIQIREDEVPGIVTALLDSGVDANAVLDACREAMSVIGKRFEEGKAFIPELIMAGEMMKGVAVQVAPYLTGSGGGEKLGCVVIGTVQGDIHDIGKDLVASILDAGGFEVVDLGVDVPAARFVEAVGERVGCVVALSCLLTIGFGSMRATVAAIAEAGLRERVRIMVGGASITRQVCDYAAADGWGSDAATALDLARTWSDGGRR
jgi:trimethylamine corrinoid protein